MVVCVHNRCADSMCAGWLMWPATQEGALACQHSCQAARRMHVNKAGMCAVCAAACLAVTCRLAS